MFSFTLVAVFNSSGGVLRFFRSNRLGYVLGHDDKIPSSLASIALDTGRRICFEDCQKNCHV